MSRRFFRPQLEQLDGRCLPSGLPAISIDNVTQVETTAGQPTEYVFTVSLSKASNRPVSVNYATVDGTATAAAGDYVPVSGMLTFPPGQTTEQISVLVPDNLVPSNPEGFYVDLSGASHATIATAKGGGTILPPPPAGYYYVFFNDGGWNVMVPQIPIDGDGSLP
jgi:hypothetical protein